MLLCSLCGFVARSFLGV